ncbi:MAG: hypothetical protein ACMUEM_03990 [Flavobacteriales bacterium AspAUS03]
MDEVDNVDSVFLNPGQPQMNETIEFGIDRRNYPITTHSFDTSEV